MMTPSVLTDTTGAAHIIAVRRHHLFNICDQLKLERRLIRWSYDLRCYVLVVRTENKRAVLRFLKINGKGGDLLAHATGDV
ncbi:Uncharacterised protein [Paenibacillus macerans]|uniref:Uncharacterized protein n=1 Tax=Paenibacillus macerans TaxID=44252 RepID=A0A090ZA46_PAEMA|nr:hypothetical protein DJ90_5685 [Paenibacillus macerans]SUA85645.1 Uncharacterised protein [Paenibacillus macerans]